MRNHGTVHSVLWSLLHHLQIAPSPSWLPHHYIFYMSSLPAPVSSVFRICLQEMASVFPGFSVAAEPNPSCLHCPASSLLHQGTAGGEGDTAPCTNSCPWGTGHWAGHFLSHTCWKGKACGISEHPGMRFPFLQQWQLQQSSAGFSILPKSSLHDRSKSTTRSICVTMETKWRQQIWGKNNSGKRRL